MSALQGQPRESNVRILDGGGAPILGLAFGDFVITFKKSGDLAFSPKTLDATSLIEISDGYYSVKWVGAEMNQLGPFLFKVASSGGTPFTSFYQEFEINPNVLTGVQISEVCVLTGNVVDLGGSPAIGSKITFNPVSGPILSNDSFIRSTVLTTTPDALGNFSVALVRKVDVRVRMDTVGINFKFTVPDQETALLKDLLPIP